MYISYPEPSPEIYLLQHGPDSGKVTEKWSSLIGVITAICGNILISFALNTQRYAHMRLSRDQDHSSQEKHRHARNQNGTPNGRPPSGPRDAVQERTKKNAEADGADGHYTVEDPADADETQPLIPKVRVSTDGSSASDTSEGSTIRPPRREKAKDEGAGGKTTKSYLKSPIWWLGIGLMVVGEAGNFLAYGFAPASIVSPLGVVALVSNCLIAPLLLGEQFRWRDAVGVLIAVGGCVVVVLSASESNPRLTPDAIWDLITRWEFETYLGITAVLMVMLAFASNKFGDKSILIDLGLVGLFGGYTALSTKGVASLLSNTIWRVVTFPITYLLVTVLVFTAVMQIKYVNRALQRFNATMVIPTQFVLFTLSVIIGSAVLYRDFERETTDDAIKFVCGCGLTFFGVWCITSGRGQDTSENDDNDDAQFDEEADAIDLVDDEDEEQTDRRTPGNIFQDVSASSSKPPRMLAYATRSQSDAGVPIAAMADQLNHDDGHRPFHELAHVTPGTASSVHMIPGTRIKVNPKKPPIHATTSAPIIPTTPEMQANQTRSKAPLMRTPSGRSTEDTSEPPHETLSLTPSPSPYLDPTSSPRRRLLSRHSVVGLLPGPFTSPLSGSLSAVVADELRRGFDGQSGSVSLAGRRKGGPRPHVTAGGAPPLSPGKAGRPTSRSRRHSVASGELDLDAVGSVTGDELGPESATPRANRGRLRSLSATLGDLFRVSPGKKRRDDAPLDS